MTKTMWMGCGLIAAAACCWRASAQTAHGEPVAGILGRELITHFESSAAGPTTLTVIDPASKALAVYHITRETGEIKLKSVRKIEWDLRLEALNSNAPTPDEIRNGFDRQ